MMDNGYVKIPIETYDALKREIAELKEHSKSLEMRLKLQFTPGIQVGTIQTSKIGKSPWYHD